MHRKKKQLFKETTCQNRNVVSTYRETSQLGDNKLAI